MVTFVSHYLKRYLASYKGVTAQCWQGITLSFAESILIGVYSFLPLYFVNEVHFTVAQAGFIISLYGVGAVCGGYLSGKLCDVSSAKMITALSLVLQACAFLVMVYLTNPYALATNLFVMGMASYGFLTAVHLWVLRCCGHEEVLKLKALNILNAAANLGNGISALLIGYILYMGFKQLFPLIGALLFGCAIVFLKLGDIKNHYSEVVLTTTGLREDSMVKNSSAFLLWIVLACLFAVGLIIFQANTTFSFYVQEKFPHMGVQAVSVLFSLNCFMVVILQTQLANLFANYNKLLILGIGAFMLGIGMLLLVFATVFLFAAIAYAIHTLGEILFFSVSQYICYEQVKPHKKGQVMGLYRTVYATSRVVGPAAGGLIYQAWGGNVLWCLCGLIGIVCLEACNLSKKYI